MKDLNPLTRVPPDARVLDISVYAICVQDGRGGKEDVLVLSGPDAPHCEGCDGPITVDGGCAEGELEGDWHGRTECTTCYGPIPAAPRPEEPKLECPFGHPVRVAARSWWVPQATTPPTEGDECLACMGTEWTPDAAAFTTDKELLGDFRLCPLWETQWEGDAPEDNNPILSEGRIVTCPEDEDGMILPFEVD